MPRSSYKLDKRREAEAEETLAETLKRLAEQAQRNAAKGRHTKRK